MIPLKDDNPTQRFPFITIGLIAANCLIYIYQMTLPLQDEQLFAFQFGLIPVEITNMTDMTPSIPFPVWLSPFSSMFLHGDFWHLAGNMLYLWIFGNNIEDYLGHIRFLLFYIISGLAAVALFIVFNSAGETPLIGASGAIAGILGAYMVLYPKARVLTLIWIIFFIRIIWLPSVFILGYWFLIQLVMGMSSIGMNEGGGVAWFAHVGGFLFGWIFIRFRYGKKKRIDNSAGEENHYYNRWH